MTRRPSCKAEPIEEELKRASEGVTEGPAGLGRGGGRERMGPSSTKETWSWAGLAETQEIRLGNKREPGSPLY